MSITIFQGSILDTKVDAIVNPANNFLKHEGGLAAIIARAAAPFGRTEFAKFSDPGSEPRRDYEWQLEQENAPLIPTGGVHLTSAGALPYKGIIHAVGPIWGGGNFMELDLLELVHENVFELTLQSGFRSIALPAISCGVFGFPVERAAKIAVEVANWCVDLDITFALFEDAHVKAYTEALS